MKETTCKDCGEKVFHEGTITVSETFYCKNCGKPHAVGTYSLAIRQGDPGVCSSCKGELSRDGNDFKCACGCAEFNETWYI